MKNDKIIPVITLDGPSGTGKGTICHMLANHLQWQILDSGSIYRVLAYAARKKAIPFTDINQMVSLAHHLNLRFESDMHRQTVLLDGEDVFDALRTERCGQDASVIAVVPEIRQALLERKRAFAVMPGLVTDGRDMGTVVFPDAILKIYLYASEEERAKRRHLQLKKNGIDVSLAQVIDELTKRDQRDATRQHAPLKPAEEAILIDTTGLDISKVFQAVLELVNKHPFFK